ncbi:spermatogenesis-associated serine-rich protein 2 isoform X2 [Rhipicephalus sanguineus]|uniref:spermatogenesis-associated serine-rich protein 2 isoform X2 n=1 Tax=Rhipicephalus sanguineus TaxID=34632 RepID=UPI001894849B|nr:spermatogenesis-associated serine-rich protein 2 isoform X2 [Rhipicephalus sanguineus]
MARKIGVRSIYDTHNNVALADGEQHGPEDLKEKLSKVREVVPSMSKDQICMALRTYDYDVNATITAISENGPEEALREWNCAGNKVKMANKNRKRKKKTKKEPAAGSGENLEANAGGDGKDVALGKLDEDKEQLEVHPASTSPEETPVSSYKQNGSEPEKYPAMSYGWGDDPLPEEPSQEDNDKPEEFAEFETKSSSRPMHSHSSGRSKSSPDVKCTDSNEASSLPSSTSNSTLPKKTCLEKSLKDLSRQTVALQRVQVLLEEQLTKAEKAIKAAFLEVQKALNDRQAQLEEEMEKVRNDARSMLQQRQKLAAELKARSETAPTLSEQSLTELRDDIKHFVVERKYDEELGKTARFVCTKEKIEKEIKDFGQVVHVRDPYTSRRLSMSSVASSSYHDSGYHQSVTSSPIYKSQYYSHDTMKEEEYRGRKFEGGGGYSRPSDGRSSKVYTNSHRSTYPGQSPGGPRSGNYSRGGRGRRPDDSRYGGPDRGGGRGGYGGGGRPHRYNQGGTGRGRYTAEVGRYTAEASRHTAETGRHTAEASRHTTELGRHTTELGRHSWDEDSTGKPSPDGLNGQL